MSKQVKAIANGFKGGKRVREGTIFRVADNAKAKWYIPYGDSKEPVTPKEEKEQKQDVNELMM